MSKIRKRSTIVIARTLDDDGWCAYIRDSQDRLHLFDRDDNFFWTPEVTTSLKRDVFSSAKKAQTHFKELLKPYSKFLPIIRNKKHVDEFWNNKFRKYPT